jgi:hypothetical protein
MGLFGSKKIYVASTVRNMAGDELKRPNYLKTTIIGNIIANNKQGAGDVIQRSYINGPGIKLRNFFRWAQNNYDLIGLPTSTISADIGTDASVVDPEISLSLGENAVTQDIQISVADFSFWAEQWMMENHPDLLDTDWEADYNEATDEIIILFEDATTASFTPVDYVKGSLYLFATYVKSTDGYEEDVVLGDVVDLDLSDPFPSVTGWTNDSSTSSLIDETLDNLTTTLITYSDGRPDEYSETSGSTIGSYTYINNIYHVDEYKGSTLTTGGSETYKTRKFMLQSQTGTVADKAPEITTTVTTVPGLNPGDPDVTKTTVVTVYDQEVIVEKSYRIDEQRIVIKTWEGPFMFIYKIGSGNANLDVLVTETSDDGEFFPFIPIRLDNKFLSSTYHNPEYLIAKKALKKAVGGKMDDIIESLNDTENLDDIDYAYAFFGVSANVLDNSARKYMYLFFDRLKNTSTNTSETDYAVYQLLIDAFNDANDDWLAWQAAQADSLDPLYGAPEPTIPPYPSLPLSGVRIQATGTGGLNNNLDMQLSWQSMTGVTGSGVGKPDAKRGDVWFELGVTDVIPGKLWKKAGEMTKSSKLIDKIRIYHQVETDEWEAIDIVGMIHRNYIYKGKFVEITLREGIVDTEDSGFLVPLHYPTFRTMSLIDSTQMSTACTFLVFNSYVVKKTGLLGSLFFKILLIVIIIAVVVFAPQLAPATVKAAVATGTALGLSGTLALIVGAAINAVAGMIISSLIMKASTAVFGKKLGLIIGTIISIAAMNGLGNLANGQGFTINFGNILSAQNLTMLTSSIGNVYAKLVAMNTMDTVQDTQKLIEQYEKDSKRITELFAQNFGYGNGVIDPLQLLDSSQVMVEYADTFLSRTLLTGTDIAEMSMDMLGAFSDITLSNDLPLGS